MVGILVVVVGIVVLTWCRPPTPIAAAVEVAPGAVAAADQATLTELIGAFDQAEAAVQKGDVEALMSFYAQAYNYHGLKRADVRRVWEEVFQHYGAISSRHVFTELKLVQADGVKKASVTCTGGLYGTEKESGKSIAIDSWVNEVHSLVKVKGKWKFLGNMAERTPAAPPASAPHHPLF